MKFIKKHWIIISLLAILAIAAFLRLYQLPSVPPGLYPDEAINANNALKALETGEYKVFYSENNGREGLFINLVAFSFRIFGYHPWSIRLISSIFGILTVLGLYLMTKEILDKKIALLSSFFLAISFWHINFSRIGFRAILIPFVLVFSFYFLFKGLKNRKIWDFIWAGIFFGLGFYTYIPFRIAPLIILAILVLMWILKQKIPWKKIVLYFSIIFLIALPLATYFLYHPAEFMGRAGQVSVFNSEQSLVKSLLSSTLKTLGMFNFRGDNEWRHNLSGSPMLIWPIGILFILGMIIAVIKFIKVNKLIYGFIISWFIIMLISSFLSVEGVPHALRSIGVIPVTYIFSALGFVWLAKKIKPFMRPKYFASLILVILMTLGYVQFLKYFVWWGNNPNVQGAFRQDLVNIGNYLNTLPQNINRYVIVNESGVLVDNVPMPAQTVKFITYKKNGIQYMLPDELDKIKTEGKIVLVSLKYDKDLISELEEKFKQGKIKAQDEFWVYKINYE